ncbi:hypothetical protein Hanom_Chr04g00286261 [Helianthus anomalus]
MSPYAIGRVKFDAFEPERWFHHIVAFIHKASLSLQLCRLVKIQPIFIIPFSFRSCN